jgi:hypothetical protein
MGISFARPVSLVSRVSRESLENEREWKDGREKDQKQIKLWMEWQREADDECRKTRNVWSDSEDSQNAIKGDHRSVDSITGTS